jgi:hypothetical protein
VVACWLAGISVHVTLYNTEFSAGIAEFQLSVIVEERLASSSE